MVCKCVVMMKWLTICAVVICVDIMLPAYPGSLAALTDVSECVQECDCLETTKASNQRHSL